MDATPAGGTAALTMPAPRVAHRVPRWRLEHVIMAAAVVALIVLVVLPLAFLLLGSVRGEQGLGFEHFVEVLTGRLYISALQNSLILGAWTGLFSLAIGFVYLFSPNAGLINVLVRDVAGLPWLTFNIFSMTGLVLVTVMHTFPFVFLLASSALQSVDASYEEAAQILGASKLRTA